VKSDAQRIAVDATPRRSQFGLPLHQQHLGNGATGSGARPSPFRRDRRQSASLVGQDQLSPRLAPISCQSATAASCYYNFCDPACPPALRSRAPDPVSPVHWSQIGAPMLVRIHIIIWRTSWPSAPSNGSTRRRATASYSPMFVHISAVERSGIGNLSEGQKVSYDLERGQQGKTSAVNLKRA